MMAVVVETVAFCTPMGPHTYTQLKSGIDTACLYADMERATSWSNKTEVIYGDNLKSKHGMCLYLFTTAGLFVSVRSLPFSSTFLSRTENNRRYELTT